jgi:hypothetical protein
MESLLGPGRSPQGWGFHYFCLILAARTEEPDLPNRLEHAYFGQDVGASLQS